MLNEMEVRKAAAKAGIDLIGFFSVEPLYECLEIMQDRYRKNYLTGFEGDLPEKRIKFSEYYEQAKMGIAFGVNYFQGFEEPPDINERCQLASVAWGQDYHNVLQKKAEALMADLNSNQYVGNKIDYKIFIDNSGLIDRGSAYRAGLGFFGKNNCLINEKMGSFFFIGQILLNQQIPFKKSIAVKSGCGDCRNCIDACPTGALGENFHFDPRKCISYLTQKKEIMESEEKYFTQYIYGCDRCQITCPYNQELDKTGDPSFITGVEDKYPFPEEVIKMTNREFKNYFKKTSAGWRGKKNLIRNTKLIMKNRSKVI
ncbi:tRNA epoxyqueuosine(34) reductase QueG [Eubacteriaceae bacterium ES3]|nr:tRNA epoxyqueuosine(34) reductase QueG [Eubacteriaceae bacterium ES3]